MNDMIDRWWDAHEAEFVFWAVIGAVLLVVYGIARSLEWWMQRRDRKAKTGAKR